MQNTNAKHEYKHECKTKMRNINVKHKCKQTLKTNTKHKIQNLDLNSTHYLVWASSSSACELCNKQHVRQHTTKTHQQLWMHIKNNWPDKKKFVRSNPSKCSLEAFTHPHTRTFTFAKKPLGLQPSKSATTQVRMVCTSNVRTSCNLYINSSRFRQVIKHAVTPNVCENRSTNLCPSSLSPCQMGIKNTS